MTISPGGRLSLCCYSARFPIENIENIESLKGFFNGKKYGKIRKSFVEGNFPEECKMCDSSQNPPMNGSFIQGLPAQDNFFEKKDVLVLEFTSSNLCNQTCATCGSNFSSKWKKFDLQAIESGLDFRKESVYVDLSEKEKIPSKQLICKVLEVLPTLKTIVFKGGEPLADKWNKVVLSEVAKKQYEMNIIIVSNLSLVNDEWVSLLELLNRKNKLYITGSIDGTEDVFEWIRGASWEKVLGAAHRIESIIGEMFKLNITVSIYNFFTLKDDLKYLDKVGIFKEVRFVVVKDPWYTSIGVLDPVVIKSEVKKIETTVNACKNLDISNFNTLYELNCNYSSRGLQEVKCWIDYVNKMRKEDILNLVPELKKTLI